MATVYEGAVLTVDENDTQVRYLVEDRGRIAFVGDELPRKYMRAQLVSLGDRCIVPAFTDTHMNLSGYALYLDSPDVSGCQTIEDVLHVIADAAQKGGEEPILAFGASPLTVLEKRLPTRDELDSVCPNRPCLLIEHGCRACVVNSAMASHADNGLDYCVGSNSETGEMTQEAFFAALSAASSLISSPDLATRIQRAVDTLAGNGISVVHAVSGLGFAGNADVALEKNIAKSIQHGFHIKMCHQSMEMLDAMRKRMSRIGACISNSLDGGFTNCDAALLEPYANDADNHGRVFHDVSKVDKFCVESSKANLNVRLTAMGDAAFHQAVHGLVAALDYWPRNGQRHGVAGACLLSEKGLADCIDRGFQLFTQPLALNDPQLPFEYLQTVLGEQRAQQFMPLRTVWDAGLNVSAASFAPCSEPNPIKWMAAACNHPVPEQSLTVQEALRYCTINGAYAGYDEGIRGSLEKGKLADFAILSGNLYEAGSAGIENIRVEQLVLQGKPYEKQNRKYSSIIASGMFGNGRF